MPSDKTKTVSAEGGLSVAAQAVGSALGKLARTVGFSTPADTAPKRRGTKAVSVRTKLTKRVKARAKPAKPAKRVAAPSSR